jgi:hypothetical protein
MSKIKTYHAHIYLFSCGALSYEVDVLHLQIVDGDCRLLAHYYRHAITQQLYQLWKVLSAHGLSSQIVSDVRLVSM